MLYNLEVLNGEISPDFSSEVFNYVVNVNKEIGMEICILTLCMLNSILIVY